MTYPRTPERQGNSSHAELDIYDLTREQLLEDLKRTKFELREREGQLNNLQNQYSTNLATKDQQIYSLQKQAQTTLITKDQELKDLTDGFRADVLQKDQEVEKLRQMWKQTAKELGKYQAQDRVVDQVTDPEMTQMARQIQYNVRNFAYQHFGDGLNTGKSVQSSCQYLQEQLQTPIGFFEACMNSPVKRPMLVGAFLWDFLVKEIFERFMWCGKRVHQSMENLTEILSERSDIIKEALDLDQLFSKQVAEIYWTMDANEPGAFHEASMELQQGEKRPVDGQKVQLVVAPGLIKRGRSTGENYEMKSLLLRMTVSCELITTDKPALPPRDSSKAGAKFKELFNTMKEPIKERAQSLR